MPNQTSRVNDIHYQPIPYLDKLQARQSGSIDLIVIHCTELPTMQLAQEFGERVHYASGTGNSGHYYVDLDGSLYQYVDDTKVANHVRGQNERSIGIEIINTGRYPNWYQVASQQLTTPYTDEQVSAVIGLVKMLSETHPSIEFIAGHEDLDTDLMPAEDDKNIMIRRKVDPGSHFPWGQVLAQVGLVRIR